MPLGPTTNSGGSTGPSSPAIATPRVLHATTAGDDDTGDGSLASPFRYAQAIYDAWAVAGVPTVMRLGVGDFGTVTAPGWPSDLVILGESEHHTTLIIVLTAENQPIRGSLAQITVTQNGVNGTTGGLDEEGNAAGTPGGAAGSLVIEGSPLAVPSVTMRGGAGGDGAGASGVAGNGGAGGVLTLRGCTHLGNLDLAGGAPGGGTISGSNGDNGTLIALRGMAGLNGLTVVALNKSFGGCELPNGETGFTDLGGNCFRP